LARDQPFFKDKVFETIQKEGNKKKYVQIKAAKFK
jgi:hypothetical protein